MAVSVVSLHGQCAWRSTHVPGGAAGYTGCPGATGMHLVHHGTRPVQTTSRFLPSDLTTRRRPHACFSTPQHCMHATAHVTTGSSFSVHRLWQQPAEPLCAPMRPRTYTTPPRAPLAARSCVESEVYGACIATTSYYYIVPEHPSATFAHAWRCRGGCQMRS